MEDDVREPLLSLQEPQEAARASGLPNKLLRYAQDYMPRIRVWLPRYGLRTQLWPDVLAGVTVGVMAVPQGLAYATLAQLSPIVGLWTAFLAAVLYAVCGGSRHVIVGPVAILSLLTGQFVRQWTTSTVTAEQLASLVAFGAALCLLLLALLRLGFIIRLMSRAVIVGFTAGAATVILMAQMKAALGAPLPPINTIIDFIRAMIHFGHETQGWTVLISGSSIAFLLCIKLLTLRWAFLRWIPGPLIVVLVTTVLSWRFEWSTTIHVATVGALPSGWPVPQVPLAAPFSTDSAFVANLLQTIAIVALLAAVEHMSIGLTFAFQHGDAASFSGNTELWSLGVAMFVSSWFSSYAPTGSFTRTAVNAASGAQTQLAGLLCGLLVMFSFLFMSPVLQYLPQAALAAIVIMGVLALFEFRELGLLFRTGKIEFLLSVATFIATILLGVENGILIGVSLQLLILLYRESISLRRSVIIEYPRAGAAVIRPSVTHLSFLSSNDLVAIVEETLEKILRNCTDSSTLTLHLDLSGVHLLDASSAVLLAQVQATAAKRSPNVTFEWVVSGANESIRRALASFSSFHFEQPHLGSVNMPRLA